MHVDTRSISYSIISLCIVTCAYAIYIYRYICIIYTYIYSYITMLFCPISISLSLMSISYLVPFEPTSPLPLDQPSPVASGGPLARSLEMNHPTAATHWRLLRNHSVWLFESLWMLLVGWKQGAVEWASSSSRLHFFIHFNFNHFSSVKLHVGTHWFLRTNSMLK